MPARTLLPGAMGIALLHTSIYFWTSLPSGVRSLSRPPPAVATFLWPALVAAVLISIAATVAAWAVASAPHPVRRLAGGLGVTALLLVATKSVWLAAQLPHSHAAALGAVVGGLVAGGVVTWLSFTGRSLRPVYRAFSCLGYALAILAVGRTLATMPFHRAHPAVRPADASAARRMPGALAPAGAARAIWVIFDELDYDQVFGASGHLAELSNFARLASVAVSATDAYSPSNTTVSSIPALLLRRPVAGFRGTDRAELEILQPDGMPIAFTERNSVVDALPGGAASAAFLGYYHPYCQVFPDATCEVVDEEGPDWSDALVAPFGYPFAKLVDYGHWGRTTRKLRDALPRFLTAGHPFTFVHLNVPHLPSSLAQRELGMRIPRSAAEEYEQNLVVADRILGRILSTLEGEAARGPVLLVVSSDHWWRSPSPRSARRIPLLAWIVGERDPQRITERISTVHTGDLILDFLSGAVSSHGDIVRWWSGKPAYPPWIQPSS